MANALNQCVSFGGETVVTDADGCVAEFDGKSFGYDSALRLDSVSTTNEELAAFAYDAFGRRVARTSGESTSFFFYDGWNLVRELRTTGGENVGVDEYFWGRDVSSSLDGAGGVGGLVLLVHDGAAYVPLYDANGNITAYVDASGSLVARYVYDCFGNVILSSGEQAGDFRFGFSTKYQDEATGVSRKAICERNSSLRDIANALTGSCKGNEKPFKDSNVEGLGAMVGLQLGCRWAAMGFKGRKNPAQEVRLPRS
jgi:YD repeat-containing protein